MHPATLVLRFAAFAVLATLVNLGTQRLILAIWSGAAGFALAVFFGTAVGLVVKYILDKRWIFADLEKGVKAHSQKFGLYTAMGIVTTLIFWGFETGAWLVWGTEAAREGGAILGLGIGYVVKYHLDRRFVFNRTEASV